MYEMGKKKKLEIQSIAPKSSRWQAEGEEGDWIFSSQQKGEKANV